MATDWSRLHGDAFRGKSTVITGGAGFIGSHLAEALLALGSTVTVVDDLSAGSAVNVPSGARFVLGTILDDGLVAEAVSGAHYVFHEAALGSVPRSVEVPGQYLRANVQGTMNVLAASAKAGVRRVMFAASSSAYGDTEELPKHEGMVPLPRSPYAATKVAGEALLTAWCHSYGLDTVSLRYFNIFGPRQSATSAYAAVIAAFATKLLAGEPPVIFGDGTQSRDFTHVANAVHANLLAARREKNFEGEVINVACGTRVSVSQLALAMARQAGREDLAPTFRPARMGDVLHSQACLKRAEAELGYKPIVSLEEGIGETVAWYRSQV